MQPWLALALGFRADEAGRRSAAVVAFAWWLANDGAPFPVKGATPGPGDIEYADGSTRHVSDFPASMGVMMLGRRGDNLYALYALALGTGLRRGELLALTWRDIDAGLDHAVVHRGKTAAAARTVPIPSFAAVALRGLPRRPGPIFPYSPGYVTRHVAVVCKRAGVSEIGMHGLRHSTASILLAEGVPIEVIKSVLGHTSATMTQHYARPEDDMKRAAMERLGKAVSA